MKVLTGTEHTRTEHQTELGIIGFMISMGVPAAIAIVGIAVEGGLINAPANWLTGLFWGIILWALALLMMTTIGTVHPAIRRGVQDDPGTAATNFGSKTPLGSLMGHLVYGGLLGLLYQFFPLS